MKLAFKEFWATYQVTSAFRNPFHSGSLWRGVLGRALRQVGCTAAKPCLEDCVASKHCLYSRLFDPPMPVQLPHRLLQGATQPPQPLVPFIPPPGGPMLDCGDAVRFGLRIFGNLAENDVA